METNTGVPGAWSRLTEPKAYMINDNKRANREIPSLLCDFEELFSSQQFCPVNEQYLQGHPTEEPRLTVRDILRTGRGQRAVNYAVPARPRS
jgi:hypothetical protein